MAEGVLAGCTEDDILSDTDLLAFMVENDKWKCPICHQLLSRKQTLKTHIFIKHKIRAGKVMMRYKQYEIDSNLPVPSSTISRWKKIEESASCTIGDISTSCEQVTYKGMEQLEDTETHLETDDPLEVQHTYAESIEIEDDSGNFDEINMELDTESTTNSDSETDELSTDEDDLEQTDLSPPLYILPSSETVTTSTLTHLQHLLLVTAYSSSCNLSGVAFQKLLDVIQLHVPINNLCESKADEVREKLGFGNEDLKYYDCCSKCGLLFRNGDVCETPGCGTSRSSGENVRGKLCFVTCDIKKQLQEILERKGIIEKIHAQRNASSEASDSVSDITSGLEYLHLGKDKSFLDTAFPNNITFSWNTDGIPLFKSSNVSLWPVYLTINELPPRDRFLKKNIMIWGIWQGASKPGMNSFLSLFVKNMTELFHNGIEIHGVTWKAMLLTGTMDLQARAYVLNTTQHNGRFGCLYCLEEGQSVKSGAGRCRSYPYSDDPQLRTPQNIREATEQAVATGTANFGIFGKTVLSSLPSYAIEKHIVIDYMHGILLGIVKKLLHLWFDGKSFKKPYFIGHQINTIDKYLLKIKPPYLISRLPRKIKNTFNRWKASELRSWLLYYSVPCLKGILPSTYLEHYSCLVEGIYLLLQQHILYSDINRAEQLLHTFYQHAAELYDDNILGLNVHNLMHYATCVKMWGPLWAYSCFGYESCNGDILKNVHGKGNVCAQIFWALQAEKRLEIEAKLLPKGQLRNFLQKVLSGGSKLLPKTVDGFKCEIVPPLQELKSLEIDILLQVQDNIKKVISIEQLAKTRKLVKDGIIFYSRSASKVRKRNSFTLLLDDVLDDGTNVICVDYYLVEKERHKVFAVGTGFKTIATVIPGRVPHMQLMKKHRENLVVPAHCLKELLI